MNMLIRLFSFCLCAVSAFAAEDAALAKMKSFSSFPDATLAVLAGGEILTQRGPLMKFRRGMLGESCYIVKATPAATAHGIQTFDPSGEDSSVHFHSAIHNPVQDSDLAKLNLESSRYGVKRFVTKTQAIVPIQNDFFISKAEAAQIQKTVKAAGSAAKPADVARQAWLEVLKARAAEFDKGGLSKLSVYETGGATVDPVEDIKSLFGELPRIAGEFKQLLAETGLEGAGTFRKEAAGQLYAEVINYDIQATLELGATFTREFPDGHIQILDCIYFSTGIFYVSMGVYELWPVEVGGKPATLVWRGDLLSTPTLEITRGVERMAYGKVMMVEIRKSIESFRKRVAKAQK
ncbi:MAG: hypothetical protein HZA91_00680 [Verrucomicrobia bacterium]|nr:hypothetical protein [Verrucomicrobiota bacterium]